MFASKPPTCTGRTLDLSRKDSDIRYLRHLGNSDIARLFVLSRCVRCARVRVADLVGEKLHRPLCGLRRAGPWPGGPRSASPRTRRSLPTMQPPAPGRLAEAGPARVGESAVASSNSKLSRPDRAPGCCPSWESSKANLDKSVVNHIGLFSQRSGCTNP